MYGGERSTLTLEGGWEIVGEIGAHWYGVSLEREGEYRVLLAIGDSNVHVIGL